MLFDWFTLFAQLVNFLLLVWLLKRFLYKPILRAIDEREKRISTQIRDAEKTKTDAQDQLREYQQKNDAFEQQRQELFNKVATEADSERRKLLEQARSEAELLRSRLFESLRNEQQSIGEEISKMAQSEVFNIARKTLNDLASANLEDHMAEVFVKRLRNLDQNEKVLLTGSFSIGINKINIRSTFEIPQTRKDEISHLIKSDISNKAIVTFETAPQLVSGLELISGGYKIAWSISDYLTSLEDRINQLLKDKVSSV